MRVGDLFAFLLALQSIAHLLVACIATLTFYDDLAPTGMTPIALCIAVFLGRRHLARAVLGNSALNQRIEASTLVAVGCASMGTSITHWAVLRSCLAGDGWSSFPLGEVSAGTATNLVIGAALTLGARFVPTCLGWGALPTESNDP